MPYWLWIAVALAVIIVVLGVYWWRNRGEKSPPPNQGGK